MTEMLELFERLPRAREALACVLMSSKD